MRKDSRLKVKTLQIFGRKQIGRKSHVQVECGDCQQRMWIPASAVTTVPNGIYRCDTCRKDAPSAGAGTRQPTVLRSDRQFHGEAGGRNNL